MLKSTIVLLVCVCSFCTNVQGQGQDIIKPEKIIPSTPEAAILQKQVKIPVDHSTGVPNISIPLFEVKTGNITVPISLNYHASGILVDQLSSSTGLGWGLIAGGAIQRNIRGKSDNNSTFAITQHFADSINARQHYISAQDHLKSGTDFSQDDYSYNFLNYNGSFYFDSTGSIRTIFKDPLKIESIIDSPSYFGAKDYAGNSYLFDKWDWSSLRAWSTDDLLIPPPVSGISAWRLTKIKHQNIDSVLFSYDTYNISYIQRTADIYDYLVLSSYQCIGCMPGYIGCYNDCGDSIPTHMCQNMASYIQNSSLVTQILSRDTKVNFYYSNDTAAHIWERKLDSIIVRSYPDTVVRMKFHFVYGLFSGNNQLKLKAVRKFDIKTQRFEETKFEYFEMVPLPAMESRSRDMFGYYNGKSNDWLIQTQSNIYTYPNADRGIDSSMIIMGTIKRINYPTGGFTQFRFEPNKIDSNTYGPGIRVKEVWEYNGINKEGLSRTTYEYHGYTGQQLDFPINMQPYEPYATYQHKIFSSNGSYGEYTSISSPVVPKGYAYDSVVIRRKGLTHDLLSVERYDILPIYNIYKSFPIETNYYKNSGSGIYDLIKKQKSTYERTILTQHNAVLADIAPANFENNYMLHYDNGTGPDCWTCIYITDGMNTYTLTQNTMLPTKEEVTTYTPTGNIVENTFYYYNDVERLLPTRVVRSNSTDSTITTIKYAQEMVNGSQDPTGVYASMVGNYYWGPKIVEETLSAQSNSLSKTITGFKEWSGFIAPELLQVGKLDGTPETRQKINQYDQYGNIAEYEKDGMKNCFLWDYQSTFPVAKIDNASLSEVAYCGFETNQTGQWTLNGGSYDGSSKMTGKKAYSLGGGNSITKTSLPSQDYIVSYWLKSGSLTVNSGSGTAGMTKNGWTYYQHALTSTTYISISGTATFDDLRLYPRKAQMATYVYEPLIGVTASCDVSNRISFYEYDGLGRLYQIRDLDSNIVKKMNYNITQSGTTSGIYYNEEQSQEFASLSCPEGYEGFPVLAYTVAAGTYSSEISQSDANAMALLEIANLGQLYVNLYGKCQAVCNPACQAPGKRCMNGECIRGTKVYTSSVYNPITGYYDCTYHLEWEDGFRTPDFYEESDMSCPMF